MLNSITNVKICDQKRKKQILFLQLYFFFKVLTTFICMYERHACAILRKLIFSENHGKRELFNIGRVAIRCTDLHGHLFLVF
jgi:hypothetical protein